MIKLFFTLATLAFFVVFFLFWGLFVGLVLPRLKAAKYVAKPLPASHLINWWPQAELDAYKALLDPVEQQQWQNWLLVNVSRVLFRIWLTAVVLLAIAGLFA